MRAGVNLCFDPTVPGLGCELKAGLDDLRALVQH